MIAIDPAVLQRVLPSARLLVALSGGLDSTALLHGLMHYPGIDASSVRAVHIHHGLHADAAQWTAHCQRFCDGVNVPLQVVNVDVARDGGEGLEAAARKARYAAFAGAMGDDDVLVTAHHRGDQAETFLLRALRASGPDGLASMRPWRCFANGWHWRPLLDVPRSALLAHAQDHGLAWIDDPSNTDNVHDRNFLRRQVMPLLRGRWPQVDAAFARSASLSAEATGLLAEQDSRALASARTDDAQVLSVPALKQLLPARRARVLRHWIAELGLPPLPAQGVAQIESQLLVARHDTEAAFAWSGAVIRRWRDVLHAEFQRDQLPAGWRVDWDGASPLQLPTADRLQLLAGSGATSIESPPVFEHSIVAHSRQGGERIVLPGREHSHTLKHVLQDLGVPPWVRERLPLLSSNAGELLAIGDIAYSSGFDAWLRQHNLSIRWINDSGIAARAGLRRQEAEAKIRASDDP